MKNLINKTQANENNLIEEVNDSFIHAYHKVTGEDGEDTSGTLYSNIPMTESYDEIFSGILIEKNIPLIPQK